MTAIFATSDGCSWKNPRSIHLSAPTDAALCTDRYASSIMDTGTSSTGSILYHL